MPIFEYHCDKCDKTFEQLIVNSNPNIFRCDICGEEAPKIISKTTFDIRGKYTADNNYGLKKDDK